MLPQYNGDGLNEVKVVWYNGTDTLKTGYILCYDLDDTNAPVSLPAGSLTTPPTSSILPRNLRGRQVVQPATANLFAIAGVVAPESSGVVGPGWVTIVTPRKGDVALVYTNKNCTKGDALGSVNASYIAQAYSDATLNLDMLCVVLETVDKSGTNGTVLAKFV